MANMAESEFRTVIEDVRTRHAAIIALIHAADAQAMGLLRLYVTLAVATTSGATAILGSQLMNGALGIALVAMTIMISLGAGFCLHALRGGIINMPGRNPDFWSWTLRDDVEITDVLTAYLENVANRIEINRTFNDKSAAALTWAKRCGVLAPMMGLVAAAGWLTATL